MTLQERYEMTRKDLERRADRDEVCRRALERINYLEREVSFMDREVGHLVMAQWGHLDEICLLRNRLKDLLQSIQMTKERECPDCKHFVGCEAACGGLVCDSFEAKAPPVSGFAEDALRDFSRFLIDAAAKQPLCAGDIPDLLAIFKEEYCHGKI